MSSRYKYEYCKNAVYHPEDLRNIRTASGLEFGKRHVQCFMAFLGVATSFCMKIHLSVAIISMTQKSSFNEDIQVLPWDSRMKGAIQSSFSWSYIFILIPSGQMAEKFGPKFILVIAMAIAGVIMVLTPTVAIYGGFYWMIILRNLLGATQAVVSPSVNFLISKWAPLRERGLLFIFVFSGVDFGIFTTMTTAGILSDSRWGWPSVFYVFGGITLLWALTFAYIGANSPHAHKTISDDEKMYILNSISHTTHDRKDFQTPWKAMMTSVPLYTLIFVHCCSNWGFATISLQVPTFINAAFGLNMKQSGFFAALPYLSSFFAGYIFAMMNDWLQNRNIMSRTALKKFWNSVAHWGGAFALFLLVFAGENEVLAVTLVIVAVTCNSAFHIGSYSNHLDLSPNFSGTLMGITSAFATISSLSSPLYAGFIVTDNTSLVSWRIVFLTAACVLFLGNSMFLLFGSTDVQPWNFPPEKHTPISHVTIPDKKVSV